MDDLDIRKPHKRFMPAVVKPLQSYVTCGEPGCAARWTDFNPGCMLCYREAGWRTTWPSHEAGEELKGESLQAMCPEHAKPGDV